MKKKMSLLSLDVEEKQPSKEKPKKITRREPREFTFSKEDIEDSSYDTWLVEDNIRLLQNGNPHLVWVRWK